MTRLRSALWLPLFNELADPAVVAGLAAEAEEAGWHRVFVWDHLRWRAPVLQLADPWITRGVLRDDPAAADLPPSAGAASLKDRPSGDSPASG